jgi:type II secretion system protein H
MGSVKKRSAGFTLIELLVVTGLIGLMLGLVQLTVTNDPGQMLQRDAERLAASLTAAQAQATATGQMVRLMATANGWRFELRERPSVDGDAALLGKALQWIDVKDDEVLGPRTFSQTEVELRLPSTGVVLGAEPFGLTGRPQALDLVRQNSGVARRVVLERGVARVEFGQPQTASVQ